VPHEQSRLLQPATTEPRDRFGLGPLVCLASDRRLLSESTSRRPTSRRSASRRPRLPRTSRRAHRRHPSRQRPSNAHSTAAPLSAAPAPAASCLEDWTTPALTQTEGRRLHSLGQASTNP
jgi:hypothetical protein